MDLILIFERNDIMKLSKKVKIFIAAIAAAASISSAALADNNVSVQFNGTATRLTTYYEYGCTYVPLRTFYNTLSDAKVVWDADTDSAHVKTNDSHAVFTNGKNYMTLNGKRYFNSGTIKIINDKMYIPIRMGAKQLDLDVSWNPNSLSAELTSSSYNGYDENDLYWLSRIIYAEAGGESYEGMIAVGNVILNRAASDSYPNTIYDVIFDTNYGVQFSPVANGTIYNTPSEDAIEAAKECLSGTSVVPSDCIYFLNPDKSTSFWIVNNCSYVKTIGDHDFYA